MRNTGWRREWEDTAVPVRQNCLALEGFELTERHALTRQPRLQGSRPLHTQDFYGVVAPTLKDHLYHGLILRESETFMDEQGRHNEHHQSRTPKKKEKSLAVISPQTHSRLAIYSWKVSLLKCGSRARMGYIVSWKVSLLQCESWARMGYIVSFNKSIV